MCISISLVNEGMGDWGSWSMCIGTCGDINKYRSRKCKTGHQCSPLATTMDERSCGRPPCPGIVFKTVFIECHGPYSEGL